MHSPCNLTPISELVRVKDWCCVTTDLGAETLLEVAMAMIAEKDEAAAIELWLLATASGDVYHDANTVAQAAAEAMTEAAHRAGQATAAPSSFWTGSKGGHRANLS